MSDKLKDQANLFHDYGLHEPTKTICLFDGITEESAATFIVNLKLLQKVCKDEDEITILINSEGGDLTSAFAIYDTIKLSPIHIKGIVVGNASSAASMILQACDTRLITPNSYLMLHLGEEYTGGSVSTKRAWDKKYEEDGDMMVDIYWQKIKLKKKKYPRKQLKRDMDVDMIFRPKQALDFGLVDNIVTF